MVRRIGSLAMVLVLLGVMLSLLLSLKRYVPLVVAFGSGYEQPWGPIPMSHEDRELLESLSHSPRSIFQPRVVSWQDASDEVLHESPQEFLKGFVAECAAKRPGGPEKNVVVAYLSMVGTIDSDGIACLVPPHISQTETISGTDRLISVADLLTQLRSSFSSDINLVVVLDACHGNLSWPLGLTEGSFPVAVQATLNKLRLSRTWVMVSAGTGETSNGDDEDGLSVFARFFAGGLEGAADRSVVGDGNGIVDLRELTKYLQAEVPRYAVSMYGVQQTPQLIPEPPQEEPPQLTWGRDPALSIPGPPEEPDSLAAESSEPEVVDDQVDWWLQDRWLVAAAIRESASHQRPRLWQQYQRLLLRAEALRSAGVAAQQQLGETEVLAERLELELTTVDVARSQYLASLRLQPRAVGKRAGNVDLDLESWTEELKQAVFRAPKTPAVGKEDEYVTVEVWNRRADAAWQWLVSRVEAGGRIDAGMLERWLAKLGTAGGVLQAEPTQIHTARMLLRELSPEVWQAEPNLPGELLRQVGRGRNACFPADVRADRMIALLTPRGEADRLLRRAIDLTIIGDPASLAEAKKSLAEVDAAYTRILQVGERASQACRMSDDLFDDLPWLVAWFAREQRIAATSGANAASEQTQGVANEINWQITIDAVARFQRVVAAAPRVALERLADAEVQRDRLTEELLQRVDVASQDATQAVGPLRQALAVAVEELTSSAADSGETLGRIERILDTPLVRGDGRLRLLERAQRLRRVLRQVAFAESDTVAVVEPRSSDAAMAAWTTWHDLTVHPIVPVLTTAIDGVSTRPIQVGEIAASSGKQLAAVRAAIGSLASEVIEVEKQAGRIEGEIPTTPPGPQREAKQIESLVAISAGGPSWRRLAGILSQAGAAEPSAVRKSLLAAWHDRLVTAANDAMDDFWAGAQPQSPVWCLAAANGFLEKAQELVREARLDHGSLYRRSVRLRLQQLESSAGLSMGDGDYGVLQLDPRVVRLYDGRVLRDSPSNTATLIPELGVPAGLAALRFAETDSAKPLPLAMAADGSDVMRLPIPVATQKEPGKLVWQVSANAAGLFLESQARQQNAPRVIDAIASFRGHRLVTAVPLAVGSVIRVMDWVRPKPAPPRVVVRGAIPRNRAVAIVFDCSGSMGQRLPDGRTRLEAGRGALYDVLDAIARDGGWSVSVWLYGHRTRWTQDAQGQFQSALTAAGKRAEEQVLAEGGEFSLLPGDDVEQIMRLQPLVPLQVARIRSLLDTLEPGGETPLYLAIDEAVRSDFGGNPGPAHVLVVTDGANDQSGGKITTSSDVRRTLAEVNFKRNPQDQVKVDVIGFDLQPGVYDRQIRLQDLQSVATDSKGRFFDATDPFGLAAALQSSLAIQRWHLLSSGGAEPVTAELNQAIAVESPVGEVPQTYDVALDAAGGGKPRRVTVAGSEAIELFVAGQGRGLEFRRYDGGLEQGLRDSAEDLPDPVSKDRRWFLGAHLARRIGSSVAFPISVQNGDADGFSPRPVEAWIEVQPVGPAGAVGLPYVFTELSFQPGRPVPVLDLVAHEWPRGATTAEIKSWIRFDQVAPEVSVPVATLAPGVEKQLEIPSLPGSTVTAQVAPLTSRSELVVSVVENHPRGLADALPVVSVSISRGCTRAVHIVVPDTGRVRHEFTVEMVDEQVASDIVLNVTDKRAIQRDAVGPPSPGAPPQTLRVVVPPQ